MTAETWAEWSDRRGKSRLTDGELETWRRSYEHQRMPELYSMIVELQERRRAAEPRAEEWL